MAGRTHNRLNHYRKSDFLYRCHKFFTRFGKSIGRCGQAKLLGGKTAYTLAVHSQERGRGRRGDIVSLLLKLNQHGSGDSFNFRNYMVGLLKLYHATKLGAVKHAEHIRAVRNLHRRSIGILVASHHLDAHAL